MCKKARDEYEKYDYDIQRVQRGLNYCNSRLPRGYSMSDKTQSKGLCSIGRTKTKSGRAETDKSKLNRKRVINYPRKWRQNVSKQNKKMIFIYFTQHSALKLEKIKFLCYNIYNSTRIEILKHQEQGKEAEKATNY